MRYKINEDGTFGGFFSDETVEYYNIKNTFPISIEERDRIIEFSNFKGYDIIVKENNELDVEKRILSSDEIQENEFKQKVEFYNSELELATKAFTEYDLGLATEEDLQEVKLYMCSISPYKKGTMLFKMARVKRPSIFDRYK